MTAQQLIVFDWNGTLLDDAPSNLAGFNAVIAHFGLPPTTLETYRAVMGFPVIHAYVQMGIATDDYLKHIDEVGQIFLDHYIPHAKQAPLREGGVEILDWLLDHNYDLAILSNFIQEHLEDQLSQRHILHKFKYISGNAVFGKHEHTQTTKLGRLRSILESQNYDTNSSFIVGDSLEEPELARQTGLKCISVTWGCIAKTRLENVEPDFIINSMDEMRDILGSDSFDAIYAAQRKAE